jgi:hypothetical protein
MSQSASIASKGFLMIRKHSRSSVALITLCLATILFIAHDAAAVTCPGNNLCLQYPNGAVLSTPKIIFVKWQFGADPQSEWANVQNFLNFGGPPRWSTSKFEGPVTQYYDNTPGGVVPIDLSGNFLSVAVDNTRPLPPDPVANWATWITAIANEAVAMKNQLGLAFDPQVVMVIMTPARTQYPDTTFGGSCARHGVVANGSTNPPVAYIDLPYIPGQFATYNCSTQPGITAAQHTIDSLTHEIVEAITDPYPGTGITVTGDYGQYKTAWSRPPGNENADLCWNVPTYVSTYPFDAQLAPSALNPNKFSIIPHWSNAANGGAGGCEYARTTNYLRLHTNNGHLFANKNEAGDNWPGNDLGPPPGGSGVLWSKPAVASWGPTRLDVFTLDTAGNLWDTGSDDGGNTFWWYNWGPAPPGWSFIVESYNPGKWGPSVSSWGNYRLDLVLVATDGVNRALFHRSWDNWADSGFQSYPMPNGVTLASGPASVAPYPDGFTTFIWATTGDLWEWGFDGPTNTVSFGNWGHPAGIDLTAQNPSAASWGPYRYDIFATDPLGQYPSYVPHVWHAYLDEVAELFGWDSWELPGSGSYRGTGVASLGDDRLKVVVTKDGGYVVRTWDYGDLGWSSVYGAAGSDTGVIAW